jgi:hypothetical protein
MLSPTWLLTWWRVFGSLQGRQLRTAAIFDGDRLIGLAPLLWRRHHHRRIVLFQRLELLGTGEPEADAICSEDLNVIAEEGAEEAVADSLAAALHNGTLGAWDEFVMGSVGGESTFPSFLMAALVRFGIKVSCTVTDTAAYIPLPPTWDGYLQELSASRRSFVGRSLRAFDKWAGSTARFHHASSLDELEEGKRILIKLHHERWTGVPAAGVFRSPRFLAFHDAVLPQLLDEGSVELRWLTVRGQPVAALYNLVHNDKVYVYQSGRTTKLPNSIRPGIVILANAIRDAIESGRLVFDFLGGVSRYKTELTLATRPIVEIRAVRPSLRESVRLLLEGGIGGARPVRRAAREIGRWLWGPPTSRATKARRPAGGEPTDRRRKKQK